MIRARLGGRRTARRLHAVEAFQFPASARQRLGFQRPDLSGDEIRTVEAAARQWFRLIARRPRSKLSMPSVVVDDLWHELVLHTRDYAALCDIAFGHFLHHEPASAMSAKDAHANRTTLLLATLNLARRDETCGPTDLPLLFRVDQELRVQGGNRYLVDCGGRGECFEAPRMVCLQHLAGSGTRTGARRIHDPDRPIDDRFRNVVDGGASSIAGCGGW